MQDRMHKLAPAPLCLLLLCGAATCALASEPVEKSSTAADVLLVDSFDGDIQNSLGGYRSTFEAAPSLAKSLRTAQAFHGKTGKSLRLEVNRQEIGFCGAWIHFFDMHSAEPKYFDASGFAYLSIWVRGEKGNESFDVQLADKTWIGKQDSVRLGEVSDYLPGGVTTKWQEVVVPLGSLEGLNRRELGGLTLNFRSPGKAVVFVDDVSFKRRANLERAEISPEQATFPSEKVTRTSQESVLPRALWVWTAKSILADPRQCGELLDFCEEEQINQLWMQLDYKIEPGGLGTGSGEPRCIIANEEQWGNFIRSAHSRKIRVDALDGAPEYAVKENHHIPLAVVDGVIKFNAASPPDQRFDGIHFDNEPYLLLGWEEQELRERILEEFLQLNAECQRRVTAARRSRAEFRFGVDIPFWWQEREVPSASYPGEVTFQNIRQPASFHCLDLLDVVGIMNYRDSADGPDGMIYHGRGILEHRGSGDTQAEVFMGIETLAAEPAEVQFIVGLPREQFRTALRGNAKHFANLRRLQGLRLNRLDDGVNIHVGIERPRNSTPEQRAAAAMALAEIAKHFGNSGNSGPQEQIEKVQAQVAAAISKSGEWRAFAVQDVKLLAEDRIIPGFSAAAVMPSKCTFAEETPSELRLQSGLAEQDFVRFKTYRGLAIHSYESYRPKVTKDKPPLSALPLKLKSSE
ncbi:MAG: alpha-amylase family protein [Pirellulaceae bacterium]